MKSKLDCNLTLTPVPFRFSQRTNLDCSFSLWIGTSTLLKLPWPVGVLIKLVQFVFFVARATGTAVTCVFVLATLAVIVAPVV